MNGHADIATHATLRTRRVKDQGVSFEVKIRATDLAAFVAAEDLVGHVVGGAGHFDGDIVFSGSTKEVDGHVFSLEA